MGVGGREVVALAMTSRLRVARLLATGARLWLLHCIMVMGCNISYRSTLQPHEYSDGHGFAVQKSPLDGLCAETRRYLITSSRAGPWVHGYYWI